LGAFLIPSNLLVKRAKKKRPLEKKGSWRGFLGFNWFRWKFQEWLTLIKKLLKPGAKFFLKN